MTSLGSRVKSHLRIEKIEYWIFESSGTFWGVFPSSIEVILVPTWKVAVSPIGADTWACLPSHRTTAQLWKGSKYMRWVYPTENKTSPNYKKQQSIQWNDSKQKINANECEKDHITFLNRLCLAKAQLVMIKVATTRNTYPATVWVAILNPSHW